MGGTPVSLDFSKAQPIAAVSLDFSKAQPIDSGPSAPGAYQTRPGGPIQNVYDTTGQQTNYAGLQDIVPKEGESFSDTMKRGIQYGKTVTPDQVQQQSQADLKLAPAVVAAAPAIGAGGAAAIAGPATLASVLGGPTIATAATKVPGGRDLVTGRMLPWVEQQIETQGPSLLRQGAGAVADFAAAHKITTGTVGLWALHKLGIHPLEILKELIE
jgi:hypothetical protein